MWNYAILLKTVKYAVGATAQFPTPHARHPGIGISSLPCAGVKKKGAEAPVTIIDPARRQPEDVREACQDSMLLALRFSRLWEV